jgi:hypothetical protein
MAYSPSALLVCHESSWSYSKQYLFGRFQNVKHRAKDQGGSTFTWRHAGLVTKDTISQSDACLRLIWRTCSEAAVLMSNVLVSSLEHFACSLSNKALRQRYFRTTHRLFLRDTLRLSQKTAYILLRSCQCPTVRVLLEHRRKGFAWLIC